MDRRASFALSLVVVLAAVLVGVSLVSSDSAPESVQDASPVGSADAIAATTAVVAGFVIGAAACAKWCSTPDTNTTELNETDGLESHKSIHQQALGQRQGFKQSMQTINNYLEDTGSIARMEAKAAYIRSLNNGSSEAVARADAKAAVSDYYAARQITLLNRYQQDALQIWQYWNVTQSTPSLENGQVFGVDIDNSVGGSNDAKQKLNSSNTYIKANASKSFSLVNGSTHTANVLITNYTMIQRYNGSSICCFDEVGFYHPDKDALNQDSNWFIQQGYQYNSVPVRELYINPPTDNFERVTLIDNQSSVAGRDYQQEWQDIEDQNQQIQAEIDNFVDTTYPAYSSGEINSSDLIDPYLGARDFSPDANFGQFNLRTFASLGIEVPDDLDNVGSMNISHKGTTYSGLLLSDESPTGGFTVGTVYNSTDFSGPQIIMNEKGEDIVTIDGKFEIVDAKGPDGSDLSTVEYRDPEYNSTDLSEFKTQLTQLRNLSTEINARQAKLRSSGGGGGLLSGGLPSIGPLNGIQTVAAGLGGLVVLSRLML